jgi:hypothetical protein
MGIFLVNYTSTYHRRIAIEIVSAGVPVDRIYRLPGYRDPVGSVPDIEESIDHYRSDARFNNTEIVSIPEMQYPEDLEKLFNTEQFILSDVLLAQFRECETVFYRHADRFTFHPISNASLRFLYLTLLNHFILLFTRQKPELVFFADSPHVAFDTVLFYVAKHFSVPTYIYERIHLDNSTVCLSDYRKQSSIPDDYLKEYDINGLKAILHEKKLGSILEQSKTSKSLQRVWQKHDQIRAQRRTSAVSVFKKVLLGLRRIASLSLGVIRARMGANVSQVVYNRAMVFDGKQRPEAVAAAMLEYKRHNLKLLRLHSQLFAREIDFVKPFIFFPLHMQPEKTTSAFGGVFEDQYVALKILSDAVQGKFRIYVKEHPAQMTPNRIENIHYRTTAFYRRIAQLDSIFLLSEDAPYDQLLEESAFVATIAGSAAWEKMLRGSPVLVFGEPWYKSCRACFAAKSSAEISEVIPQIMNMRMHQVELELLRFILFKSENVLPFATNPRHVQDFELSYEAQIRAYAEHINQLYIAKSDNRDDDE